MSASRIKGRPFLIAGAIIVGLALVIIFSLLYIRSRNIYTAVDQGIDEDLVRLIVRAADEKLPEHIILLDEQDNREPDLRIRLAELDQNPSTLFAADPYVLIYDQRTSPQEIRPKVLEDLFQTPQENAAAERTAQLALAAQLETDFGAFLLYLGSEWLSSGDFTRFAESIGNNSVDSSFQDLFATQLNDARARQILPGNWTNWDRTTLQNALREGSIYYAFAPRSMLKSMPHLDRFNLRFSRLPSASGRLRYSTAAVGLALVPGSGFNAGRTSAVLRFLRSQEVQALVESESVWTSVSTTGPFLPIHQRSAQSILANSERLMFVRPGEVFEELRIRLR